MENVGQHHAELASARLFVYGTLRKGFASHGLLQRLRARFIAPGYVLGRLYDLGEYPGAITSTSDAHPVHGEVYLLPCAARSFEVLDRYEGIDPEYPAGNEFEREESIVVLASGGQVQAWVYWLRRVRPTARLVLSGNY